VVDRVAEVPAVGAALEHDRDVDAPGPRLARVADADADAVASKSCGWVTRSERETA
jgi:hypothetical protein